MAARTWVPLAALLLAATALAGCTGSSDEPTTPAPREDPPTGSNPGEPSGANPPASGGAPTAAPENFELAEGGSIQGSFDKSWQVPLENVAFRSADVHFALKGAQPDAPPTARVTLQLLDPAGTPLRTATLGLGGEGDALAWHLTPADLLQAGTYTLRATAGGDAPLPSVGLAEYELSATIRY